MALYVVILKVPLELRIEVDEDGANVTDAAIDDQSVPDFWDAFLIAEVDRESGGYEAIDRNAPANADLMDILRREVDQGNIPDWTIGV